VATKEGIGREGVSELQSFPPASASPSEWFQQESPKGADGALYMYYGYLRGALMPGVLILYCKSRRSRRIFAMLIPTRTLAGTAYSHPVLEMLDIKFLLNLLAS
jgi:hypothetical protein